MSGFPLFQTCKMNISSFKLFSWSHKIFLYCKTYSRSIFFRATSRIARFKKFKTDSTEIGINVQKSLNKKWNILTEQLLFYFYLLGATNKNIKIFQLWFWILFSFWLYKVGLCKLLQLLRAVSGNNHKNHNLEFKIMLYSRTKVVERKYLNTVYFGLGSV